MVIPCKKPCKKKRSTMLTVEQMVDIALGTPEIGAVNFNVLHALIHVMVQQLNIQKCLVEFKGYDSDRMEGIILTAKPGPILKLSEYMIDVGDGTGKSYTGKERGSKSKTEIGEIEHRRSVKDAKEGREGREVRDIKDTKEAKEVRDSKEVKEGKEVRDSKEVKEGKEIRDSKEVKEGKEVKDSKDLKEGKEGREGKEGKEGKDGIEGGRKIVCDCATRKRTKSDDEGKEKTDKGKDELEADDKKRKSRKDYPTEESETEDEHDRKNKEVKKQKSCPCKVAGKDGDGFTEETLRAVASSYYGSDSEGGCQTIVRVEPVGERCDSWRSRPALAHESMVKLEEKVALLQEAFEALEQMPTNEELKKKAQGTTCPQTPVKDLWQLYNLNKRVECLEGAIEKLASMIEDLVKDTGNFREALLTVADAVDDIECSGQLATTCCTALLGTNAGGTAFAYSAKPSTSRNVNVNFSSNCDGKEPCFENGAPNQAQGAEGVPPLKETQSVKTTSKAPSRKASESDKPIGNPAEGGPGALVEGQSQMSQMATNENMEAKEDESGEDIAGTELRQPGQTLGIGPEFFQMSAAKKFCVLKDHINCLICQMKTTTDNFPIQQLASKLCAIVSMQKQLDSLEKEWKGFTDTFKEEDAMTLSETIHTAKNEIEHITQVNTKLISDKQELEGMIRQLFQEIENLKKTKADIEVVEDLLAEKADASLVNRKVSHDQFDAACDDLTKGLDEALDKLMQQEAMWNEAMDELQRDVQNKLDKNEIMPLKEFINKKLKCLQEKLKQLAQLRKDAEAAGAKSRILRNINCIVCDNDVVMKMDNTSHFQPPSLHASKSIKPLITYELDQVRKAMKKGPPCRVMNHVEEAVLDAKRKSAGLPLTSADAVDRKISKLAHFCNRYCGGSHTVTTPQQRVTRIGHFLTEFGPQALALFNQENLQQGYCPSENNPVEDYKKPC